MSLCVSCLSPTKYVCLRCKKPACNKSVKCSIPASEETVGWKAGVSVGFCPSCSSRKNDAEVISETVKVATNQKTNVAKAVKAKVKGHGGSGTTRHCLTLSEKVDVIREHQRSGETTRKLAQRFDCGKTQIIKVLNNKDSILDAWSKNATSAAKRHNAEKFDKVNNLLWEWYEKARQANIPIDGPMLREEARILAEQLGETAFKGTDGWLAKWKQRHNIAQMHIAGEEGDVRQETVESWEERVKELIIGYEPSDIWNMDETGTFWKALPDKSLSEKGKRCRGGKHAKQRITAAFFVNAAGGKEAPILIGKSKKPRCFAKLPDITRPYGAMYFSNAKAWMKSEIMLSVLRKLNDKMKRDGRHIILLMDNAPCHPPSMKDAFSNIKIEFLPANTTSRTQPLDAGIIKSWKMHYKRKILRHVVSAVDGQKSASEIIKGVNLLMAIEWMVTAWEEVKPEVITRCFKHVGMYPEEEEAMEVDDDPFAGEEELDMKELLNKISGTSGQELHLEEEVDAYEKPVDSTSPNWREHLRSELLKKHDFINEGDGSDDDEEEEEFDIPLNAPEVTTAVGALGLVNTLIDFSNWENNEKLSRAIGRVKDILIDEQLKSFRQTSIKSYFA